MLKNYDIWLVMAAKKSNIIAKCVLISPISATVAYNEGLRLASVPNAHLMATKKHITPLYTRENRHDRVMMEQ